jgi:hypothetical protein
MQTFEEHSAGDTADAWARISQPARWHEWAPHVRGAWGLGSGEVRAGDVGAARLLGVAPVPVAITAVDRPRSWTWRVAGMVDMEHRVQPRGSGCTVAIELRAPAPLEAALALAYGPVIRLTLRRLARLSER